MTPGGRRPRRPRPCGRTARRVLVAGLVAALVAVCTANAARADGQDEFYRAVELDRAGRPAEAAEILRALVDRAPTDPFADDALGELARLYEERLGDPLRAAGAWERLLGEHPGSRLAVRARRRAEALRAALGPDGAGAAALAELQEILHGAARRPHAESIARMERLVARHPDAAVVPRAVYWLGTAHRQAGDAAAARARYREVLARWPDSEWAHRARKAEGDLLLERGDFDGAERAYRELAAVAATAGSADLRAVADEALARVPRERWRARGVVASWTVLVLAVAAAFATLRRLEGSVGAAARAAVRPPVELLYLAPVAVLFAGAALTEHLVLGRAIVGICAGGLAAAWLSGVVLDAARRRHGRVTVRRAAVHAAVTAAAIAAVCYISVTRERLMDMLIETIRFGAER